MIVQAMFHPHHVSLSVEDLQRSIAFYRTFGFQVLFSYVSPNRDKRMAHLGLSSLMLELFELQPSDASPRDSNRSIQPIGIRHFALQTESIEAAHKAVIDAGHQCDSIATGLSSMRYFFVRDPDGIWFEVVEDGRQSGVSSTS